MKKTLAMILAILMMLSMLTGCGGAETPAATPAATQAQAEAPAAPEAKPFEGVTLNVLDVSHVPSAVIQENLGEFEEMTGMKVNLEIEEYASANTKKEIELSGGSDAYDVMHTDTSLVNRYATAGWAEDLTPYIEASEGYQYDDFYASASQGLVVNDAIYGVPTTWASSVMFYRADIFEALNLEVPGTPDELLAVCEAIAASDYDIAPIVMRTRAGQGNNVQIWLHLAYAMGGGIFNEDETALQLNSEASVKALEMYKTLINDYAPAGFTDATYTDSWTAFAQGQAAMLIEDQACTGFFQDPEKAVAEVIDHWDCAPIFGEVDQMPHPAFSHGLMINVNSKQKEAAWAFIEWYTNIENQARVAEAGYVATSRATSRATEAYAAIVGPAHVGETSEAIAEYATIFFRPVYLTEWTYIGDTIGTALQEVIVGADAQATMDKMQADMTAFFTQEGYIG